VLNIFRINVALPAAPPRLNVFSDGGNGFLHCRNELTSGWIDYNFA
jgi:hypothetical protein